MREIEVISTSDGSHFLEFGFNANELASFKMQLYIEKHGKRTIDWLSNLSLGYTSFIGGNIYLHNSDEVDRCTWFGEKKDCKVGVVINEKGNVKKILDSLEIKTDNGEWEVESIIVPPDKNYPYGMESKIPARFFKRREGSLYSEFLRNGKTSGSTLKAIELLNGEPLRANSAYMVLKNTSADKVSLYEIVINMTNSR